MCAHAFGGGGCRSWTGNNNRKGTASSPLGIEQSPAIYPIIGMVFGMSTKQMKFPSKDAGAVDEIIGTACRSHER
jgi:hypothetical protein